MRTTLVTVAAVVVAAVFVASASARPAADIVIRHQMKGCHAWAVDSEAFKASQKVTVVRGTSFTLVNNDVMPHTLLQVAGPKVSLTHALLNHVGAKTTFALTRAGTYRFTTRVGEDYKGMEMKTIGEDNVLRLTVVVP
jgi:plastocyanin